MLVSPGKPGEYSRPGHISTTSLHRRDGMSMDRPAAMKKLETRRDETRCLWNINAALDDIQGTTQPSVQFDVRLPAAPLHPPPPAAALHREGQDAAALKASGLAQQTPSKSSKFELRVAPSLLAQQAPRASSSSAAQHC
ncbi:uncharacterized protein Triagg1_4459 [Trichoderma aggressivum f. europaeum]|uniref:Uncharacterized protein n=1 Tax=Trichoderma aggressivum f. europaeum TaxID=173218 RepID=A0AAE1IEH2_9HYPO|nr:hypothetical protein Triagg1_4459 [Trichoderma aggressivum f. europaeum]